MYGRNVLPAQYRNRAAVLYLAVFMGTSDFDLKYAIERYDTSVMLTAQREQIDLARAQVALANEAIQNQEYANWLNEQTLNMAEQGNEILKSMENAKAKGKTIGRPAVTADTIPAIFYKHYPKYKKGEINKAEFSRLCDLSYPTIYKYLRIVEQ